MDRVATPRHYIRAAAKCRHGVNFKLSVQKYRMKPFTFIQHDMDCMIRGKTPPLSAGRITTIRERGKARTITPIKMRDRVNQRVLCDNALTPMIAPRLIYDNGASLKGKGVGFARKRLNMMLEKAKRKWGNEFYALTFDFKKFFDSIPHELCRTELERAFTDKRIVGVTMGFVEGYGEERQNKGVCLGSHVSQIMALCVPNFLDHYIKDVAGVQFYIRNMDDGIVLHNDKEFLKRLLETITDICEKNGLQINQKKTHIVPIKKGVCFLKIRYRIDGMKTVRRLCRDSVIRTRRRLKKYVGKLAEGKMTMDMISASIQSWEAHANHSMSFRQRKRMRALYRSLFEGR